MGSVLAGTPEGGAGRDAEKLDRLCEIWNWFHNARGVHQASMSVVLRATKEESKMKLGDGAYSIEIMYWATREAASTYPR